MATRVRRGLAAIPGFGGLAYIASGPVRANRLLLRVMVDATLIRLPWQLYERSGARQVVTSGHRPRPVAMPAVAQHSTLTAIAG